MAIRTEWRPIPINFNGVAQMMAVANRQFNQGADRLTGVFDKLAQNNIDAADAKRQAIEDGLKSQLLGYTNQDNLVNNRDRILDDPNINGTQRFHIAQTFQDQYEALTPAEKELKFVQLGAGNNQKTGASFNPANGEVNPLGSPYDIRSENTNNIRLGNRTPAAILEYEYLKSLPESEQPLWFKNKRQEQQLNTKDNYINQNTGKVTPINNSQAAQDSQVGKDQGINIGNFDNDMNAYDSSTASINDTMSLVDNLVNDTSWYTAGPGGLLQFAPGTPQKAYQEKIKELQSRITLDALQTMGQNGAAALTPVSDKDAEMLANAMGSLDNLQDPKAIMSTLKRMNKIFARNQQRSKGRRDLHIKRYERDTGNKYEPIKLDPINNIPAIPAGFSLIQE